VLQSVSHLPVPCVGHPVVVEQLVSQTTQPMETSLHVLTCEQPDTVGLLTVLNLKYFLHCTFVHNLI